MKSTFSRRRRLSCGMITMSRCARLAISAPPPEPGRATVGCVRAACIERVPPRSELTEVRGAVRHAGHPLRDPRIEAFARTRRSVVPMEELVIAVIEALQRRRVAPARLVDDRNDLRRRHDRAVWRE